MPEGFFVIRRVYSACVFGADQRSNLLTSLESEGSVVRAEQNLRSQPPAAPNPVQLETPTHPATGMPIGKMAQSRSRFQVRLGETSNVCSRILDPDDRQISSAPSIAGIRTAGSTNSGGGTPPVRQTDYPSVALAALTKSQEWFIMHIEETRRTSP